MLLRGTFWERRIPNFINHTNMWIQSIYDYYTCLYYNLIYFSEKINFVVVCCCCFTSLDLRARFHFECIQLCISRILFQVSKTELFLLRFFDYKFNFCCEFWSWMFLNHRKKIISCFDGLNQSHSILSCIFGVI